MRIAVTGGMGSGKSSVVAYMVENLQADYVDSDAYCKEMMQKGRQGWLGIVAQWGKKFLDEHEEVDRDLLRQTIFTDDGVRAQLEGILHPLVLHHITALSESFSGSQKILLVEVPLLFEVGWQHDFDKVVTVYATHDVCVERIIQRDGVKRDQAEKAIKTQKPLKEKAKLSDYVIDNSGPWDQTSARVEECIGWLKEVSTRL